MLAREVLVEDPIDRGGVEVLEVLVVDLHHRSLAAGRETFRLEEGELAVLAGLAGVAAEALLEVFLDRLPPPKAKAGKARPLLKPSPFQPVERDFAFVVDAAVPAEKVQRTAHNVDRALIAAVAIFDSYAGPGIPDGKKSVAIAVTIQPTEKTLTDAEIEALGAKIVAAVQKQTGGVLRS